MNKMNRKVKLITYSVIVLYILVLLSGCTKNVSTQSAIETNISTKVMALDSQDMNTYLTTITDNDYYYKNEQIRWFTEMTQKGIQNIIKYKRIWNH